MIGHACMAFPWVPENDINSNSKLKLLVESTYSVKYLLSYHLHNLCQYQVLHQQDIPQCPYGHV